MKRKLLLLLMVVVFAAPTMMAQLTKGKPSADVIRTGNRAKAGDFGFYFGFYNSDAEGLFEAFGRQDGVGNYNLEKSRVPLPLVNMKYMVTNKLELRMGIEIKKSTLAGEVGKFNSGQPDDFVDIDNMVFTNVDNLITPGFAYHFSNSNVFDVYVGAEIPVGYTREKSHHKWIIEDDDTGYRKTTSMAWNVGLGGFLGVQAYIGNLPLAVGMEWGIFGRYNLGNKSTTEFKADKDTDMVKSYNLTQDELEDLFGTTLGIAAPYDHIKSARKFFAGNQLRFTVTYFFNK